VDRQSPLTIAFDKLETKMWPSSGNEVYQIRYNTFIKPGKANVDRYCFEHSILLFNPKALSYRAMDIN